MSYFSFFFFFLYIIVEFDKLVLQAMLNIFQDFQCFFFFFWYFMHLGHGFNFLVNFYNFKLMQTLMVGGTDSVSTTSKPLSRKPWGYTQQFFYLCHTKPWKTVMLLATTFQKAPACSWMRGSCTVTPVSGPTLKISNWRGFWQAMQI